MAAASIPNSSVSAPPAQCASAAAEVAPSQPAAVSSAIVNADLVFQAKVALVKKHMPEDAIHRYLGIDPAKWTKLTTFGEVQSEFFRKMFRVEALMVVALDVAPERVRIIVGRLITSKTISTSIKISDSKTESVSKEAESLTLDIKTHQYVNGKSALALL
jgi:hypothetical protein